LGESIDQSCFESTIT